MTGSRSAGAAPFVGRATERAALARALAGRTRLIVVTGGPGSGKTALVSQALPASAEPDILVGSGKHAEGEPGLRPLLGALRQLVEATLERLFEPAAGRALLDRRLGPLAAMLAGEDRAVRPEGTAATGIATLEQTAFLAGEVLGWAQGLGLPCLLWIDDWDRAAPEVGSLYRRLVELPAGAAGEGATGPGLIGSGRTWPGFLSATPESSAVIHLGPLAADDRQELIGALLGPAEAEHWHRLLGADINTPLAVIEHLSRLRASDQSDPAMPADAALIARLVAAAGDSLPLDQLATALGQKLQEGSPALAWLAGADTIRIQDGRVSMRHDTVRDRLLSAPHGDDLRAGLIGAAQRLLDHPDPEAAWAGGRVALDAQPAGYRPELAARLGPAAVHGLTRLEVARAHAMAQLALKLAGGIGRASRPVLLAAASTAHAAGDLGCATDVTGRLRAIARERADIAEAARLSAISARQAGDLEGALSLVMDGLAQLGVRLPARSNPAATLGELVSLAWRAPLAERAARNQAAVDPDLLKLMALAATVVFESRPEIVVHMATAAVTTPGARGTGAAASSMAFLSGLMGRHAEAARWGGIALGRLHPDEPDHGGIMYRAQFFGRMWRHPAASFDAIHDQLHTLLLAEGNVPLASWALRNAAMLHWRSGRSLETTARLARRAQAFARQVGDALNDGACQQTLDAIDYLMGCGEQAGAQADPGGGRVASLERPGTLGLESHTMTWLACYTYAGEPEAAMRELATTGRTLPVSLRVHPGDTEFRFHRAVNMLLATGRAWPEDLKALAVAARLNPADHAARHLILRALVARDRGRTARAANLIQEAIALSTAHGRQHDRGLAARLAGQIAPELAIEADAIARQAWDAWGGGPHAAHLGREAGQSDLAGRLERAEQELRAKGRLLAMVGHELRTPLQAATGAAELLAGQRGEGDEQAILGSALDRLGRIVDDLSDIAVAEGSALAVQPQAFEPAALLRSLIATHTPVLEASGRRLAASLTGAQPWHFADAGRLAQVADNLLVNATRHGAGEVLLEMALTADRLRLAVEDQGSGLTEAAATTLFEPFVRGQDSVDRAGHGLGLWLARKLAVAMGGALQLAPPVAGRGARFELEIPCPPCPAPRQTGPTPARRALTILLVEDEPLGRTVLSRLLRAAGHRVVEAGDRSGARTLTDNAPPDAALIDLNLPDGSGVDVARDLRERWPGSPIQVVIATAQLHREATGQISGLVDSWVAKPVGAALLAELFGRIGGTPMPAPGADELQADAILAGYAITVRQAVEAADLAGTAEAAHRLIGAAGAVGRPQLAGTSRAIDAAAARGDWTDARALAAALLEQLSGDAPQA